MTQEKKYREVLFVGRFQPPHLGHVDCLRVALEMSEQVVLVIGSINVIDAMTNPFSFDERQEMWRLILQDKGWSPRVRIIGVADYEDDDVRWAEEILVQAPHAQAVFGHNTWTNDVLSAQGLVVEQPGLLRREELQGVKIRAIMRTGDSSWRERVPACLVGAIAQ
jgi:nicotinamide-nucleotide adenylyltransferase